jgi:hypothetical protein
LCTFFVLIGGGSTDANATDLMVASLNWQTARKGDNAGHMRDIGDSAGLAILAIGYVIPTAELSDPCPFSICD